jgi:hypothetical protein
MKSSRDRTGGKVVPTNRPYEGIGQATPGERPDENATGQVRRDEHRVVKRVKCYAKG